MEENKKSLLQRSQFLNNLKKNTNREKIPKKCDSFEIVELCEGNASLPLQPSPNKVNEIKDICSNADFLKCYETYIPPSDDDEKENITTTDPFADSDNDSKDKNYDPDLDEYIEDSDTPTTPIIFKKKHMKKQRSTQKDHVQHCQYATCVNEIYSTCGVCLSFLCWDHFENEGTYNDCQNHNKVQPLTPRKSYTGNRKNNNTNIRKIALDEKLPFPIKKSYKKNVPEHNTQNKEKLNQKENNENITHCEYADCDQDGQSSCERCSSLLCLNHFTELNCHFHKNIVEVDKVTTHHRENVTRDWLKNDLDQHCEYTDCNKSVLGTCLICNCLLCLNHFELIENCGKHMPYTTDLTIQGPILTKDGTLRKRKLHNESLADRNEQKIKKINDKYAMKEPCLNTCKKKCSTKFDNDQRQKIHTQYRDLDWEAQGVYIKGLIKQKPVERRKQGAKLKKNVTLAYYFVSNKEGEDQVEVCKPFFLGTLGYDPKNDRRVLSAIKKPINELKDLRGCHENKNKIDREIVKSHVMKYNPTISHYRRKHAPKRLYLPSDINTTLMFKDFCFNHPEFKISLEVYRKIVKNELNISFAHLGHEECEQCAIFDNHDKAHVKNHCPNCEICDNYEKHHSRYTISRQEYQNDVQKSLLTAETDTDTQKDTIYYSVDLQKVIMLPRIEQYKAAIFCPRIVAFNETFVPLGSSTKSDVPYAAVWPETISGRNKEDIISTFRAFLMQKRDTKHIVLWLDNCAAQNKNWAMLSFLVGMVNSDLIASETISLKYFEPGHTYMSADSFHHQVEMLLKRKDKVYDFSDFVDAVAQSNSKKNIVKEMKVEDFYDYKDLSSQAQLRKLEPRCYLKDIMFIKVQRGQYDLIYKTGHEKTELRLQFLMQKIKKQNKFPPAEQKSSPRGITHNRKAAIIEKLVPLMPNNRKGFWYNLPIIDSLTDLSDESED